MPADQVGVAFGPEQPAGQRLRAPHGTGDGVAVGEAEECLGDHGVGHAHTEREPSGSGRVGDGERLLGEGHRVASLHGHHRGTDGNPGDLGRGHGEGG